MTLLGWAALAYVGLGLLTGYRRGFLRLAASLAGYGIAFLVARRYYRPLGALALKELGLGRLLPHLFPLFTPSLAASLVFVLSFAVLLVTVELVAQAVAGLLEGVSRLPLLGGANRLLGALMGGVEHLVVVGLIFMVLVPFFHPGASPLVFLLVHPFRLPAGVSHMLPDFRP